MKYPSVLIFISKTDERYTLLMQWSQQNAEILDCTVHVSNNPEELSRLHDLTYHVLVSLPGDDWVFINSKICDRMRNQWIECDPLQLTAADFSHRVNSCYAHYLINPDRTKTRPTFSVFTTTYNTGNKIYRAYNSLIKQTMRDWEWVVVDDSPDDDNFFFLRNVLSHDPRVRLYRRAQNSGSIGNVKNEAVSLCRGKYVLELDHDDEIMPTLLEEAAEVMDKDPDVGFVYSDFFNVYEPDSSGEKANFKYSDFISFGYGGYYCIYVPDDNNTYQYDAGGSREVPSRNRRFLTWRYVYITPNVNNITASALISLPNHPRIWRKTVLDRAGNYSENLPICDDMEILIRTFALLDPEGENPIKVVKIHKPLYVQYMNAGGNNFSLIRNREINRIGPQYLYPLLYEKYKMHDVFQRLGAYEDPVFLKQHSQIWKRADAEYEHKYANAIVNRDVQQHLFILGLRQLLARKEGEIYEDVVKRIDQLRSLPNTTELIVLDRERTPEELCSQLEVLGLINARAYAMEDCSWEDLERFAERMMCIPENIESLHIIGPPDKKVRLMESNSYNMFVASFSSRHEIINDYLVHCPYQFSHRVKYLEIGVEWGHTYTKIISDNKTGVDPSPKWDDNTIVRKTSDAFFAELPPDTKYDIVFIDGMHHAENVWRDLRNALQHLTPGGVVIIDDVLPQTEEEQWRIPRKHVKEDGILKYGGSPWTGDVWKAIYMFMRMVKPKTQEFRVYSHPTNYRGVLALKPNDTKEWVINMPEEVPREAYVLDYTQDFSTYLTKMNNGWCEPDA